MNMSKALARGREGEGDGDGKADITTARLKKPTIFSSEDVHSNAS